ncbi:TPA: hypothetical protein N0F65_005979 [Lagenidium giganteum]|uniref:NYN domain-containing protein n=1 Tax=Lagenidium giganteum TaxID=4803 RepID=A0AAV2ZC55_9STRA|nr:TPA: hypothetical protein N0F65_005979 [Lagenidium giganteum]
MDGSTTAADGTAPTATATPGAVESTRTALVIDGAYAYIGARRREGGKIDYVKLRRVLEEKIVGRLNECWFFDQEPVVRKSAHQGLASYYTALKLAPPHGPQFQLKLYAMKDYSCRCKQCGHHFTQLVQKGVDNGIATKILSLAYENICDRFILLAGDGDFYDSLNLIKNVLRKDLWVIGYRDSVSADLQQLASSVIWLDDVWTDVNALSTPTNQVQMAQSNCQAASGGNAGGASVNGDIVGADGSYNSKKRQRRGESPERQVVRVNGRGSKEDRPGRRRWRRKRGRGDIEPSTNPVTTEFLLEDADDVPGYGPNSEMQTIESDDDSNEAGDNNHRRVSSTEPHSRPQSRYARPRGGDQRNGTKPVPTLTLSDLSSSDDSSPGLSLRSRAAPRNPDEFGKEVVVIDLASDSDIE